MPNPTLSGLHGTGFGDAIYSISQVPKAVELNANGSIPVSQEGEVTYTAVFDAVTLVATPTDFIVLFGVASKVIRINQIALNVTTDSAVATTLNTRLAKRNITGISAGSATLTGLTATPHRSDSAAAGGVASLVATANYTTLGTLVGYVRSRRIMPQLATYTATNFPAPNQIEWNFANNGGQSLQLLSASEFVAINGSGGTLTGTCTFSGWITWTENTV